MPLVRRPLSFSVLAVLAPIVAMKFLDAKLPAPDGGRVTAYLSRITVVTAAAGEP
jgi:hypothetical protein